MPTFERGKSGNPNGRPAGSRNRLTMAMREEIAAGANPLEILQRVARGEEIKAGPKDAPVAYVPTLEQMLRAASKLADKILPDAKDGPINFDVGTIDGPDAALAALGRIAQAVGEGALTPSEADAVISVVGAYLKTYETAELERRIRELEEKAK